ncbi:uncharacterized protein LOC113494120 [Trichoplusia ni]|uniref:Uncharacterized protein LOC113494120 n=1 Tax=Trichoplusia ni TaxID=7111 RepID=A0A7E5VIB6_TRINI|nr:uncharacterized protein LOC113494120 [Trichoplusia ni]
MITLLLCLIVTIPLNGILASLGHTKVASNLPKAKDIDDYLTPLEKIIEFCVKHKLYIDLNFEFGLFLVNVNLKNIVQAKAAELQPKIKYRLEELLMKNDVVNDYFHYMVKKTEENSAYDQDRKISRLFLNETIWPRYMQKFNVMLLEKTKIYSKEQLEKIYGKWDTYETNVNDYEKYRPSPDDSGENVPILTNT